MNPTLMSLKLTNFRSIDTLELKNLKSFSVFAGANGSGKSNFFDALDFAHQALRFGAEEALRKYGGSENVSCYKRKPIVPDDFGKIGVQNRVPDSFLLTASDVACGSVDSFDFEIQNLSAQPKCLPLCYHPSERINRLKNQFMRLYLYRIHPEYAKQPSLSNQDPTQINSSGSNLAAVLYRMEKKPELRDTIVDWLQLVVPTLQNIQTDTERLTGSKAIAFVEAGLEKPFPPHLISDGTIYLLCLLVAVLDRGDSPCMTLIEEPERGLHPKAIQELVELFRVHATQEQPIWITTHSESIVRCLHAEELWLVDKMDGTTRMQQVHFNGSLPLDQAWLSNALGGGLPW